MKTNALLILIMLPVLVSIARHVESEEANFFVKESWLEQAIDHENPAAGTFRQQIFTLESVKADQDAKVFFILGGEGDATSKQLERIYLNYGQPENFIFVLAEHRGYGQSITGGDQSKPDYVRVSRALEDFHQVTRRIRSTHRGPLIVAGYSYSAALAINFASKYPDDAQALLASSAPIHWPFVIPQFSEQAVKNLGPALAARLKDHIDNLSPESLYDENWEERELITGIVVGLSQMASQQKLKPYLNLLSYLPTELFIRSIKLILPQASWDWVEARKDLPMPHDRAVTGRFGWYTWKYQQCNELGTFFEGAPFSYTTQEHIEDCQKTFGELPQFPTANTWDVAGMIDGITIPQIFVVGGMDPWSPMGVRPNHQYDNIDYLLFPDSYHCPDRTDPEVARKVFALLVARVVEKPVATYR